MPKPTKSVATAMQEARARVSEISAAEAAERVKAGGTVFVDLREAAERAKSGTIPGAIPVSRGFLEFSIDPESPMHKEALTGDAPVVLYCASGGRSALALAALQDMGYEAAHIRDGFGGYAKAGGPVDPVD